MAKDDNKLIIEVALDEKELAEGFQGTKKIAKKTGKKAGQDFGKGAYAGSAKGLDSLKNRLLGLGAALVAGLGAREAIEASSKQQKAVNALESSLKQIGAYTPQLSKELQNYASELQKTSRFGDEATLDQMAFAQAMGANVEQSKEIVAAAQDMATALNIDFNSAVRNISKTLGGFAGELGEVIPELKDLTKEQLMAGQGIDLLAAKYRGFALRDLNTFEGQLTQTRNSWGDMLEKIGDYVTKSPEVIDLTRNLSNIFATLGEVIETNKTGLDDFFEVLNKSARGFNHLVGSLKEPVTEMDKLHHAISETTDRLNALRSVKSQMEGSKDGLLGDVFGASDEVMAKQEEAIKGVRTELGELLKRRHELLEQRKLESGQSGKSAEDTERELAGLREMQIEHDKLIQKYVEMGYSAEFAKAIVNDSEWQENVIAANQGLSTSFSDLGKALKAEAGKIRTTSGQIANVMLQGIGNGAGQAFAAFGKALAEGENALESMLNSFLSSMGQMAVQLGTMYLMEGLAMLFSPIPSEQAKAPGLIKAGAALAVFGGTMGAVAGGGVGGGSSTASSGYTVEPGGNIDRYSNDETQEEEERRATQAITVNIQGNVLDGDESGLRIVEMINKSIKEQGVSLA